MLKTMTVPQAIIISSLAIASAIFFVKLPQYSLVPTKEGSGYIRFNTSTGQASVCSFMRGEEGYEMVCTKPRDRLGEF